ncbi:MAG TPA: hypothetical protein VK789_28730 [Bryobacteraceae bacterium]|nr:hypothetical protein [Bryobacteraceae bacterium]
MESCESGHGPATKHPKGALIRLLPIQILPATLACSIGSNNSVIE